MRRHPPRRKPRAIAHALDDAGDVGGAVELAHLAGHADVRVDERLVVGDHVLGLGGGGALERVRGPAEEVAPQRGVDELQQRQDAGRSQRGPRGLAVEEEVEELEAERVALDVESVGAREMGG